MQNRSETYFFEPQQQQIKGFDKIVKVPIDGRKKYLSEVNIMPAFKDVLL